MNAFSSLAAIQKKLTDGPLTCQELVRHYLGKIHEHQRLNAFLEVYEDEALQQANTIDQKLQNGQAGRLAGMVIGLKDVLCYAQHPLQCASNILEGFHSQFTATAIQRLLDEDVIIIGRQNCDEFAMGSSNENSAFGAVANPIDPTKVPGGSSGASAAAVKAGLCLASIGSDTGGSVRQPAAFCGVIGLKPTYSRISRYGLAAYASSFDCIGILSQHVDDAALLLEIMAGKDPHDGTSSSKEVPAYTKTLSEVPASGFKIAYLKETLEAPGLSPAVKQVMQEKIDGLRAQGHEVNAVDFSLLSHILPVYYILTTAEASSNLARYDGVRYGFRFADKQQEITQEGRLVSMYKQTRSAGFGPEVQRRILLGTFVLSADYYDAYYTKAQKVRRLIQETTDKILSTNDFIILPTTPTPAFSQNAHRNDPVAMYLEDLFTVQANVTGIPAISLPLGEDEQGMPIGLQVMAPAFGEAKLLAFSKYLMDNP